MKQAGFEVCPNLTFGGLRYETEIGARFRILSDLAPQFS
jgi:hypothetical protein